jgi:hypothetical protein
LTEQAFTISHPAIATLGTNPNIMPRKKQPKSINIVDRRRRALELRRAGATYEQVASVIAKELKLPKYSRARAYEDIDFALAELNREFNIDTEGLRRLELEKIDRLELGLWKSAINGDPQSVKVFVSLMDRRAKLCGLDAPVQMLVNKLADQEIESLVQGLRPLMSEGGYLEFLRAVQKIED